MILSKKEISILIEIIFSISFAFIFIPYFYENNDNNLVLMDGLVRIVIEILVFASIYFSVAYSLLEFVFKKKETKDERDDLINSKSYKVGYLLYEFSLFIFIGYVCSRMNFSFILKNLKNEGLYENFTLTDAGVVFMILGLLVFISIVKSLYQFYLYRSI